MTERFTFEEGFRMNSTVVVDNEEHHVYAIYQRLNGRMYLRCSISRCPGKAVLSSGLMLKVTIAHTHPGNEKNIVERRFAATCKKRAVTENTSLREIYDSEAQRLSIDTTKVKFNLRSGGMYRHRRSRSDAANAQAHPACMAAAIIASPLLRADADGQWWFRGHLSGNEESAGHVLVFASEIYKALFTSTEMHIDVTTGCVPNVFMHLCTIHAATFGHVFPCVYALMTRRSPAAFQLLFKYLKETLCPAATPSVVMADKGMAGVTSAIARVYPDSHLITCWFHYTRALWRECVQHGLAAVYETESTIAELLRMAACLPLLPNEHVQAALDALASYCPGVPAVEPGVRSILTQLTTLVESMYGQPRRTGCGVATFAVMLKARMGVDPDISAFLDRLRKIDKQERIDYLRALENKSVRAERNNRYLMHDRRVIRATLRLEDGTDSAQQFLSNVGQAVGTILLNIERGGVLEKVIQRPQDTSEEEEEEEEENDEVLVEEDAPTEGMNTAVEETPVVDPVLEPPYCTKYREEEGETEQEVEDPTETIPEKLTLNEIIANDHEYSFVKDPNAPPRLTHEDGPRKSSTLVVDNLQHHVYSVYQRLNTRLYLRCCNAHCSGKAVVAMDEIKVTTPHSHPGSKEAIRERRFSAACKRRAETETTSLRDIIETESQRFNIVNPPSVIAQRESGLYKRRRRNRPGSPKTASELVKLIAEQPRWRQTTEREMWFRAHLIADGASDIVVFASDTGQSVLAATEELQIDVIDTCIPSMFESMLTVHGAALGHVYPCVYALMTSGTPTAYSLLLHHVANMLCPGMNPGTVLVDHHPDLTTAVTVAFPNANVCTTWFHFSRTLWYTWQQQDPEGNLNPDENVLNFMRQALSLPLLPSANIQAGLDALLAHLTSLQNVQPAQKNSLYSMLTHVQDYWVEKVGTDVISVYGHHRRTSNYMENFRSAMRARMGRLPNVWTFLTKLLKVENRAKNDYQRANEGSTPKRDRPPRFLLLDKKVLNATTKLEDGSSTVDEFLVAASHAIGFSGTDAEWVGKEDDAATAKVEAAPKGNVVATKVEGNIEDVSVAQEVEVPAAGAIIEGAPSSICQGLIQIDDSGTMYLLMPNQNQFGVFSVLVNSTL